MGVRLHVSGGPASYPYGGRGVCYRPGPSSQLFMAVWSIRIVSLSIVAIFTSSDDYCDIPHSVGRCWRSLLIDFTVATVSHLSPISFNTLLPATQFQLSGPRLTGSRCEWPMCGCPPSPTSPHHQTTKRVKTRPEIAGGRNASLVKPLLIPPRFEPDLERAPNSGRCNLACNRRCT